MYPVIKLLKTLAMAKYGRKMQFHDKGILSCRVGITDADMFGELNNARYLNYMELGRWDFSFRVGFADLMKKNKWGVAVGGVNIRYRRRIAFGQKFTLTTELVCHDGRWFYFLQETHRKGQICSSALVKVCATSKDGLVPSALIVPHFDEHDKFAEMPEWVSAWIAAEGQRPWPSKEGLPA